VTVFHTHVHKKLLPEGTEVFQTSYKAAITNPTTSSPHSSVSTFLVLRASIIQQSNLSFFLQ